MSKIPNLMSFFWSSPKLSWIRYLTIASFCRLNPAWEVRLYSCPTPTTRTWKAGESIDSQDYNGPDYTYLLATLPITRITVQSQLENAAASYESDLFSYHQLGTVGGWYADMDILWIQPMPVVTEDIVLCKTCGIVAIGFMGAVPNCQLWQNVHRVAKRLYNKNEYQSCGVIALNGYLRNEQYTKRLFPQYTIQYAPTETVYPFDFRQTDLIFNTTVTVPDQTIGIHWFGGHPISQRWNHLLTRETFNIYNNTFTKYGSELCL